MKYEKPLQVSFLLYVNSFLKIFADVLIIKELIKYENKFNRKVFRNFFLKINFKNFHIS